ncbi:hypothetical protein CAURIC_01610 [Corynebacterium auriscanis]|nr:hypothetical protein CAURIC_01610 [Corynebacterium auriscanis]
MHSTGNITADTMCRTVELGVCITGAANAGDFHDHPRRSRRRLFCLPRMRT